MSTVEQASQAFGDPARHPERELCISPVCHPERSEGSLRPSSQTLRCAQGDRHDLQMSR